MDVNLQVFDPARMPERDAKGWAYHPDLDNMLVDGNPDDELPLDDTKIEAAGFEACYVCHEYDTEEGTPEYAEYWKDGAGVSRWQPGVPDGEGWQLVAVYDTENGPYAMFVRPAIGSPTQ